MRRQRRKRTTRRRGLQHIGDVLASILNEPEQDQTTETAAKPMAARSNQQRPRRTHPSPALPLAAATVGGAVADDSQSTFSFYQAVEV